MKWVKNQQHNLNASFEWFVIADNESYDRECENRREIKSENNCKTGIDNFTHHIGLESHLDQYRRCQAVRPSIVDCVSLNYYQQAALKFRSLSSVTLVAIDSPLISLTFQDFSHFSALRRCSFSNATSNVRCGE